jgi:glutamine synthetase
MIAAPDPDSYVKLPWRDGVAVVMCDIEVEGQPWPYTPRVLLRQSLERLREERGMELKVGVEAEYHLVRRRPEGGIEVADPLDRQELPCYDAKGLTRMFDHLSTVSRYMNKLGWTNYANDHEDGNGQFEQNFLFDDSLTTADRVIFFRYMVHTLAHEAGMAATFMPKPFTRLTGNGLHMNTSLWSTDDRNLFAAGRGRDRYGLGLSRLAYQFAAGVLEHARALSAVVCPTVNSYKRMGVAAPSSGATWAPAYVAYGANNRTQLMRVPEGGRIELRAVDGSANPYLAFTAVLAAGLDGIDRRADPGRPNTDNLYTADPAAVAARGIEAMPPTLLHAVEALVEDDVLRAAFGKTATEDYVDYFARIKEEEFRAWHAQVTDWEVERYLTLF